MRLKWIELDELTGIFQESLQIAAKKLENEGKGPIRYTVADFNVEFPAGIQIDKNRRKPFINIPSIDEIEKVQKEDLSRVTLHLRPTPFREGVIETPGESGVKPDIHDFADIIKLLEDKDDNQRIKALKELENLAVVINRAMPLVRNCLNDPNKDIRTSAKKILDDFQKVNLNS